MAPKNTPETPSDKQVTGATDKQHPFKLKRILIKVSVRTDFLVRAPFLINASAAGGMEYHWEGGEVVPHATVTLAPLDPVVADASGIAKIDITTLADGPYPVSVSMAAPVTASTPDPAGPQLARSLATPPARIYRPLLVNIKLKGGEIVDATDPYDPERGVTWGRIGNRNSTKWTKDHLPIDYRPVWMTSPREHGVRGGKTVTLIICHATGGGKVGPSINTFKSAPAGDSDAAHYLIDHDGHIIKFCREDHHVDHAGPTVIWSGARTVNPISVGIEMVHHSKTREHPEPEIPYNSLQIRSLIGLLRGLTGDATLDIAAHRIVGHSDVDFFHYPDGSLGARDVDPGQNFEWDTIEAAGLGMIPQAEPDMSKAYGGFFAQVPGGALKQGDNDAGKKWGGSAHKPYDEKTSQGMPVPDSLAPIKELQDDLSKIGYSCLGNNDTLNDAAGKFEKYTAFQVKKFQWHFFSHDRKRGADGKVDQETAKMIKRVKAGIP